MKLTRTIRDAVKNGYSSDFIALLWEFGKWSRYFGCQGYGGGARGESYVIDDESAAILDRVLCRLKREHPGLYLLFTRYYIGGMTEMQIVREIRRLRLIDDQCLRYANTVMIRERIQAGELWILEALRKDEND